MGHDPGDNRELLSFPVVRGPENANRFAFSGLFVLEQFILGPTSQLSGGGNAFPSISSKA